MALIKTIALADIGPVDFHRHPTAKRIILTVKPFENIRITLPRGVSVRQAKQFVAGKTEWVTKKQAEMTLVEKRISHKKAQSPNLSREAARKKLVRRLDFLASQHNFHYAKVFIRKQKTRWGSCSSKNNINLNYHLALIPEHLMDYVLLHELVHTQIKNHSPQFWKELEKYIEHPKKLRNELKKFQHFLM